MSKTKKIHEESETEQARESSECSDTTNERKEEEIKRDQTNLNKHKNKRESSTSSSASSASSTTNSSTSELKTSSKLVQHKSQKEIKHESRSKWDSPVRGNKKKVHSRSRSKQRKLENTRSSRDERKRNDYEPKYSRIDRNSSRQNKYREDGRLIEKKNSNNECDRDREFDRNRDERRERVGSSRNGRFNEYNERSRSPRRDKRSPIYEGREHKYKHNNRRSRSRNRHDDNHSYTWGKKLDDKKPIVKREDKEKPNFALSGALTEDTNKVNGVVVKYSEPPEARRPKRRWRLYPFKGETALPVLHIHRQSSFLVGRDRKVVDLAVDHPSCSKQHAALQYRLVNFKREDGSQGKRVRLYLIDLDSANGTFLNNKKVEPRKYYELLEKDVVKFGFSTREYVLLHENSKEDQEDDDVAIKQEEPEESLKHTP